MSTRTDEASGNVSFLVLSSWATFQPLDTTTTRYLILPFGAKILSGFPHSQRWVLALVGSPCLPPSSRRLLGSEIVFRTAYHEDKVDSEDREDEATSSRLHRGTMAHDQLEDGGGNEFDHILVCGNKGARPSQGYYRKCLWLHRGSKTWPE